MVKCHTNTPQVYTHAIGFLMRLTQHSTFVHVWVLHTHVWNSKKKKAQASLQRWIYSHGSFICWQQFRLSSNLEYYLRIKWKQRQSFAPTWVLFLSFRKHRLSDKALRGHTYTLLLTRNINYIDANMYSHCETDAHKPMLLCLWNCSVYVEFPT